MLPGVDRGSIVAVAEQPKDTKRKKGRKKRSEPRTKRSPEKDKSRKRKMPEKNGPHVECGRETRRAFETHLWGGYAWRVRTVLGWMSANCQLLLSSNRPCTGIIPSHHSEVKESTSRKKKVSSGTTHCINGNNEIFARTISVAIFDPPTRCASSPIFFTFIVLRRHIFETQSMLLEAARVLFIDEQ